MRYCLNIIGAVVWIIVYSLIRLIFSPAILDQAASLVGIAVVNTAFKVLSTALLLPMSSVLERLAEIIVPAVKTPENTIRLDERLLATPSLALEQSRRLVIEMAETAQLSLNKAIESVGNYAPPLAGDVRNGEDSCDKYEDVIGTYLIKVSSKYPSMEESEEARRELDVITAAVSETLALSCDAFIRSDVSAAAAVEPLEQVVDDLKEQLRTRHILRMKDGKCSAEAGFVWSDLLTNLERVGDHCSNIAGCVIDRQQHNLNLHKSLNAYRKSGEAFEEKYRLYREKYALAE